MEQDRSVTMPNLLLEWLEAHFRAERFFPDKRGGGSGYKEVLRVSLSPNKVNDGPESRCTGVRCMQSDRVGAGAYPYRGCSKSSNPMDVRIGTGFRLHLTIIDTSCSRHCEGIHEIGKSHAASTAADND